MPDKSQRTEQASAKHKKEMREKGTVARSQELGGWASLLLIASLLPTLGSLAATKVSHFMQETTQAMGHPSLASALALLGAGLQTAAFAALPILLVGTGIAVLIAVAQVGLRFTPKALRWQFSRISPKAGFSRTFSTKGLWTLAKSVLKLTILALVGYLVMHTLVRSVLGGDTLALGTTLQAGSSTVVALIRDIGWLALAIAAGDYYFQRRSYQKDVKMTKQEVKDERRQSDGSPEMRRAVRQKARRLSRMHMMAAVANADVVVTNPTHFAVALAYDRQRDRVPRVVAKGADYIALEIRERARAAGIVIVENPLLARTLHASVEVNDVVPPHLYGAVARLLAYVYSLSSTAKTFNDVHVMSA